ncbi:MAG: hypothetical protein ACKOSS_06015 [Planctomycetia bacterium]
MSLPVLLPPEPPPPPTLPPLVAWVAVAGLAVALLGTLPSTLERRRLDGVHASLKRAIVRQEAELERWERMRREAGQPSYLRERALRDLLAAGRPPAPAAARPAVAARAAAPAAAGPARALPAPAARPAR